MGSDFQHHHSDEQGLKIRVSNESIWVWSEEKGRSRLHSPDRSSVYETRTLKEISEERAAYIRDGYMHCVPWFGPRPSKITERPLSNLTHSFRARRPANHWPLWLIIKYKADILDKPCRCKSYRPKVRKCFRRTLLALRPQILESKYCPLFSQIRMQRWPRHNI